MRRSLTFQRKSKTEKLYNLTMEERVRIANRVRATDEAWKSLNIVKDDIVTEDRKRRHARSTSSSTVAFTGLLMSLKRSLQFVLLLTALLLPVIVEAQAPTPAPSPVRSLSTFRRSRSAPPGSCRISITRIVSKLMGWFELLAWVLGNAWPASQCCV